MKTEEFIRNLEKYAFEYIEECESNTKEVATGSGKVLKVKDRHLPTIQYFLRYWLVKKYKKTIDRSTWYDWLNLETSEDFSDEKNELILLKSNTIKKIEGLFTAIATDVVANEGKGIFYAKNKLGMTDKIDKKVEHKVEQVTGMKIINDPNKDEENK